MVLNGVVAMDICNLDNFEHFHKFIIKAPWGLDSGLEVGARTVLLYRYAGHLFLSKDQERFFQTPFTISC